MKSANKTLSKRWTQITIILVCVFSACQDPSEPVIQNDLSTKANGNIYGHLKQTGTYSSDVAITWMNMQLKVMRTTSLPNVAFSRPYAYSGIALYESVVPGMPAYQSLAGQLNNLADLPQTTPGFAYHWPSCANAALAYINKQIFATTSDANKNSIDSLEAALSAQYQAEIDVVILNRSIAFGKGVAEKIFEWAQTDGYLHASDPYTPTPGPGLWEPTPPGFGAASTPYWGDLRTIVPGSGEDAQPGPPPAYSTDPSSDFYKMAQEVYDVSQTLTPEQTAMALYWRDVPGVTTPGHYVSILKQVLESEKPALDEAAIAYALGGIIAFDAGVSCWETKYHYNLVRPITYIRNVLGYTTWNSLLTTPGHPEYSSAHAVLSAATAAAFSNLFGNNYSFTDHTYDYLGYAPRHFNSFEAFGVEAGDSRLFAGIHYQPSIDIGLVQGRKVAQNIESKLKFLK
jgi:hypothetical protein